jgi:hypothetical protein
MGRGWLRGRALQLTWWQQLLEIRKQGEEEAGQMACVVEVEATALQLQKAGVEWG